MTVYMGSIFRNASLSVSRWATQVEKLAAELNTSLHAIAVEGDSTDDTWDRLQGTFAEVLKCEHGGKTYDSVNVPQRWRQISVACNTVLAAVCAQIQQGDRFIYVEQDLIWEPDCMIQLLADLDGQCSAVSPMSMRTHSQYRDRFYDLYGYVKDGVEFMPIPPYHAGISPQRLTPIDSSGSCMAMTPAALKVAEFSAIDCPRGIGRSLRAAGFTLFLDPRVEVRHP